MTATSSPAEPPESALAAVLAEHRWNETRGDSGDRDGKWWRCSCGHEANIAGMSGYRSWRSAHDLHVAAAILAATPTAAHAAELEAALAAAEARLRAVRVSALRDAQSEISRMLDGFPAGGRHTRARWAVAWMDYIIERAERDAAEHVCDTGHFDRTLCPEPCGSMHSYCATCGVRQDPCAHEGYPYPSAGFVDRLRRSGADPDLIAKLTPPQPAP